jgi:hypothetical protein
MIGSLQTIISSFKSSSIKETQSNQSKLCVNPQNESIWCLDRQSMQTSKLSSNCWCKTSKLSSNCWCQERSNDNNSVRSKHCPNSMIVMKQFRKKISVSNVDNATVRTPQPLSSKLIDYLMSINTSMRRLKLMKVLKGPVCYLMQFVGTCRKSWNKSTKFTKGMSKSQYAY